MGTWRREVSNRSLLQKVEVLSSTTVGLDSCVGRVAVVFVSHHNHSTTSQTHSTSTIQPSHHALASNPSSAQRSE